MSYEQEIKGSAVFIAGENDLEKNYGSGTQADAASTGYRWSANICRASMRQPSTQEIIMLLNEVYIVRYSKNNPAASGVPGGKAKLQGVLAYACYHNLTLTEPAEAEAGEYFRVMVKLTPSAAIKAF